MMAICKRQIFLSLFVVILISGFGLNRILGHGSQHCRSTVTAAYEDSLGHAHCGHDHHHHHHHPHHHHHAESVPSEKKLPEELAEEDLKTYGFGAWDGHHHDGDHGAWELSRAGLWLHAMGCSLLVSLASLICLMILPLIFIGGKPSKLLVDSLALFGAGAMLGDAFLHQLPHTFGGGHAHSLAQHVDHVHLHDHSGRHAHSLKDLQVGLSILAGIVVFLLIEKLVRFVEEVMCGTNALSHFHHHHHHQTNKKLKDDGDAHDEAQDHSIDGNIRGRIKRSYEDGILGKVSDTTQGEEADAPSSLRRRNPVTNVREDRSDFDDANGISNNSGLVTKEEATSSSTTLVFGYLNLFSDGVHNFTDGMALGSAFLLYGSVGGWSRTVFLLAHELPQEIGDFGILVRSGFSVYKALAFNFLSALMALAGTALALILGEDPGQSSLIEGFTAGGFIYVAVAGVLAEMNSGSSGLKSTAIQLTSLIFGMAVALCISLVE